MRIPPKTLLLLAPVAMLACSGAIQSNTPRAAALQPTRPTVNHAVHKANDLECIDCHDPDETGTPVLPKVETCFDCHEDLVQENERVQARFKAARQEDGSYRFWRPSSMADLILSHENHAKQGVACDACHGEPSETAFPRPEPLDLMNTCRACHEERKAPADCAACHKEARRDEMPRSHQEAFLSAHGPQAPDGWLEGAGGSCTICHEVPRDCTACHAQSRPSSHREAGFRLFHGRGDTDALDGTFLESSCALCHKEQSCVTCHNTTRPRSHTANWQRRLHGIAASVERQSCETCHKQDTCNFCHQNTEPVSHRSNWGSGSQAHCLQCHEPLKATSCFTCHKNTLGHFQAPPLPADGTHATARDCQACHGALPHFDDGGSCRRCHR